MMVPLFAVFALACTSAAAPTHSRGVLLEDLSWIEAEKILTPEAVVVIPLGAESKEHGPHLKLKNDFLIAEYLKRRVLESSNVVVAPTINYSFYPAFVDYPGTTSLRMETARDVVIDVCRSLAKHGPRRFYVINTGVSTLMPLEAAAKMLALDGILMRYTNIIQATEVVAKQVSKQEGGTHADEIETSMMLYIAPESVDMTKAAKDFHQAKGRGGLTRDPNGPGIYSPTGIWGDATLATREKGRLVTEALISSVIDEIEALRRTPMPLPESVR
jgi:creatinine amidohydrolase